MSETGGELLGSLLSFAVKCRKRWFDVTPKDREMVYWLL
jgi:hypothetical protein